MERSLEDSETMEVVRGQGTEGRQMKRRRDASLHKEKQRGEEGRNDCIKRMAKR